MIVDLLKEGKIDEAVKLLIPKTGVSDYLEEYKNARDIRDTQVGKRVDKILTNSVVTVAKIPIPFQRKIVQSASVFLFGSPVDITSNSTKHQEILDMWTQLRMDSILLKFAEAVKSETEAAIVFYSVQKNEKPELKARLLTQLNGTLLPYFDQYGDMTAFGWKYKVSEGSKEVEYLYLFTEEISYVLKNDNGWKDTDQTTANLFGKIPVVYLSQEFPEWEYVKGLIDRYEMNLSKFADTNDYFASPMYKAKGAIKTMPSKDDTGKIIKLDIIETDSGKIIEADLDVISWDRAPEALELEFETEKDLIYGLSDTPDLSFNNVKGISNVSGIALKLMFFGSVLKAKWDEGDYSVSINRCLKVIVAGMSRVLSLVPENENEETIFKVTFTSVLPDNLKETIETLITATGGKAVMSQQSGVKVNPYIQDSEAEMEIINTESQGDALNLSV